MPYPPPDMQSAMGIIRSFRGFTRHTLITFGKMRKKRKSQRKTRGEREGGGCERVGEFCDPRVCLKYLRYARNNGNNIGCLATALFTTSSTFSEHPLPPPPLFSPFPSQLTHSPFPLFHLALSVCLVWSNLPFSHLIGRETKTRND